MRELSELRRMNPRPPNAPVPEEVAVRVRDGRVTGGPGAAETERVRGSWGERASGPSSLRDGCARTVGADWRLDVSTPCCFHPVEEPRFGTAGPPVLPPPLAPCAPLAPTTSPLLDALSSAMLRSTTLDSTTLGVYPDSSSSSWPEGAPREPEMRLWLLTTSERVPRVGSRSSAHATRVPRKSTTVVSQRRSAAVASHSWPWGTLPALCTPAGATRSSEGGMTRDSTALWRAKREATKAMEAQVRQKQMTTLAETAPIPQRGSSAPPEAGGAGPGMQLRPSALACAVAPQVHPPTVFQATPFGGGTWKAFSTQAHIWEASSKASSVEHCATVAFTARVTRTPVTETRSPKRAPGGPKTSTVSNCTPPLR